MPTKNIYVRESDTELWEKAEELAGASVSSLITEALRRYVEEQERKEQTEMETIKVELSPSQGMGHDWEESAYAAQFEGRWLLEPDPDGTRTSEPGYDAGAYYGVALTKHGNIAVYTRHCNDGFAPMLDVYSTLEQAEERGEPGDILARAAASPTGSELGVDYVRKLNI